MDEKDKLPVTARELLRLPRRVEARVYQMLLDLRAVWIKQQKQVRALEERLNKIDYKCNRKRKCGLWPDWKWPWK